MKSLAELEKIKEKNRGAIILPECGNDIRIVVGMATCGIAAGARPVFDALEAGIKENALGKQVSLIQTGCVGVCQYEPVIEIYQAGKERVTYVKMTAEKAAKVLEQHIMGGKVVEEYTITYAQNGGKAPADGKVHTSLTETVFCKTQLRQALRNCGLINPESIDEYIAMDGYKALGKALTEMTPDQVIETVLASGLRGRGGAGFPTGMKWKFASGNRGNVQKYVCCNADEGDPHAVVEAMAIAGYAIGADQGYVYVRAEYPVAVKRLKIAIEQAKEYGLLGKNIFGTDFSFDLDIRLGAGAFVCGEETALMTSIEGKRGEPRPRPPFPAIKGLFEKPTILNNVETYANIPQIILNGAEWFSSVGTEKSKGTKVFALGGKIKNTGLVEVPMGTTLRHIIEEIGGGIPNGKKFKAAQTGGPSGGCIPASLIDTQIDYDNLLAIGSMMGSGGLIVMDEDTCMVDLARFFLDFTVDESCGKCTPCRVGTRRLLEILDKIISGNGEMEDIDRLEELSTYIKSASLCGLGQTAPNPVLSTLRYFRDEYIAHIVDKKCPAGVCKKLIRYEIDPEKCIGCGMCAKNCPASTIVRTDYTAPGHKLASMKIEQANCVKCGACMSSCKFGAISKG